MRRGNMVDEDEVTRMVMRTMGIIKPEVKEEGLEKGEKKNKKRKKSNEGEEET